MLEIETVLSGVEQSIYPAFILFFFSGSPYKRCKARSTTALEEGPSRVVFLSSLILTYLPTYLVSLTPKILVVFYQSPNREFIFSYPPMTQALVEKESN